MFTISTLICHLCKRPTRQLLRFIRSSLVAGGMTNGQTAEPKQAIEHPFSPLAYKTQETQLAVGVALTADE